MIASLDEMEALPFMAVEYVLPEYSRSKIEAAGKALAGKLTDIDEAVGIFRIAHNWRDAHVFPMRRIRFELTGVIRKAKATGITAARIKRMKSIRKKLQASPLTLYQIQDIGGCRAIVSTIDELRNVAFRYSDGYSKYAVIRHWPYVTTRNEADIEVTMWCSNSPAEVTRKFTIGRELRFKYERGFSTRGRPQ